MERGNQCATRRDRGARPPCLRGLRWLVVAAVVGPASADGASKLQLSDRALRVPPGIELDLQVDGSRGCIDWVAERNDVVEILGQRCEGEGTLTGTKCCKGATSIARLKTLARPLSVKSRWFTFVHAQASVDDETGEGERDSIYCEVNVAQAKALEVGDGDAEGLPEVG